jgi:hypothetical protein
MAKQVVRRQGTAEEHQIFTGAEGEWTHDNTLNTARFHDGETAAGYPALLSNNVNEISTDTTLTGSNFGELIVVDSTTGNVTITLPDPSLLNFGWQVAIKKSVDANSVTVDTDGASTIDGDASVLLENAENAVQVRSDGSNWYALRLNNFDDAQEILYDNSGSSLAATTVKGALDELDADKVEKTSDTGAAELPVGTEAQRDTSPQAGYIRFNSDIPGFEGYNGTEWGEIGGGAGATGGGDDEIFVQNGQTVTTDYTIPADKNAMSTGPITINDGVTVTISTGSRYVVI